MRKAQFRYSTGFPTDLISYLTPHEGEIADIAKEIGVFHWELKQHANNRDIFVLYKSGIKAENCLGKFTRGDLTGDFTLVVDRIRETFLQQCQQSRQGDGRTTT